MFNAKYLKERYHFSTSCRGYPYILFETFMWEAMFELAAKKKKGCF
jgi:hypothetical protein